MVDIIKNKKIVGIFERYQYEKQEQQWGEHCPKPSLNSYCRANKRFGFKYGGFTCKAYKE